MKTHYIKFRQWLFASLLAVIGLSSCTDKDDVIPEGPSMYGLIWKKFTIKTKVINAAEEPVEGIEVIIKLPAGPPDGYPIDTLTTDSEGKTPDLNYTRVSMLIFEANDIDGEKNGYYANFSDTIKFTEEDFIAEEADVTIILQEKEDDSEE